MSSAEITAAAGRIMDIFTGGDTSWRLHMDRSLILESADWARSMELAAAAISAPSDQAVVTEALRRMVYEATHLSPCKPNGDHDCTIKAGTLAYARTALTLASSDQAGWQDIATAPFNELVWCFEPHDMGGFMFAGGKNNGGNWYNNFDDKRQYPTHWMLLPTAPTLTPGEGGGE